MDSVPTQRPSRSLLVQALLESRWWLLLSGLVLVTAAFVDTGVFALMAGLLVLAVLVNQLASELWGRASRGDSAPPLTQTTWTKAGVVAALLTLITGAAAINSGLNLLYLMFGAMIGHLVVSGLLSSRVIRGLVLHREVPRRAFAMQPFDVDVTLRNAKRYCTSFGVTLRESLRGKKAVAEQQAFAPVVLPGQTVTLRVTVQLPERGMYKFGPFHLASCFPFGLFQKVLRWGAGQELVVYPAIGRSTLLARSAAASPQWERRRKSHARLGSEEFHGLREYRPGDNPKWIHWRTSARFAKLMVRELESNSRRQVSLLLDTYVPVGDLESAHRFETAVSFAATVACECALHGRRVALVTLGPELQVVLPDAPGGWLDAALHALALVEPVRRPVRPVLLQQAQAHGLLGGDAVLICLGGTGAAATGTSPLRTLSGGVLLVDVAHAAFGSVFSSPFSTPAAGRPSGHVSPVLTRTQ